MAADGQGSGGIRTWRRSSRCSPVGNCVEVGWGNGGAVLRDSKGEVALPPVDEARWRAFTDFCRSSG